MLATRLDRKSADKQRSGVGLVAHLAGGAAEDAVARHYDQIGGEVVARRWRCGAGEIDMIARSEGVVVFVEVKQGPTHAAAAERLGARQMLRLQAAAAVFLGGEPGGELTPARFDVALVDGCGRIEILENAIAA